MIYFDNASTTPIDPRVLDEMLPNFKDKFGNASSVHSFGRESKVLLEDARDVIAEYIGASSSEIYFTSGGTEANNFAIKGIAFSHLGNKNHIVTTKIEHSAVLDSLEYLHKRFGFKITYLNVNRFGEIDLNELGDSLTEKTFLLCVMHSNNELGIINDIKAIAEVCSSKEIYLHTDSVQSIGKTNFNIEDLNCSTATMSAHKIYGPKGIGALFIKKDTLTDKFIHGGKQERDRRGGTENIAAIAGFKNAVEILKDEMEYDIAHYKKLKHTLITSLKENFSVKIILNSKEDENSLPNIVNISFDHKKFNIDAETILMKLDMNGIAVSSGSACTSGTIQQSHVLKAIGANDIAAKSSLRISFGRFNVEEDVENFVSALKKL